ncbi:hypothetical protein [Megasphaera coli]|uniref:hypothetical protein n=1 Tax=Colibacter massiliensis TaxID=1852379 RepID=UPI00094E5AB9|nr:hypothetical protein [Colibacter massiliensis]
MIDYNTIALSEVIDDEEIVQFIIDSFSCPLNPEVETFLRDKSIEFERLGLSRTYFIFGQYKGEKKLLGYYAIAVKHLSMVNGVSNRIRKIISGYSGRKDCAVYLVGQLAKNYKDRIDQAHLITGRQLLQLAIDKIMVVHRIIGGRAVVVECEDIGYLKRFYEEQGFQWVDKDKTDHLLRYYIGIDSILT